MGDNVSKVLSPAEPLAETGAEASYGISGVPVCPVCGQQKLCRIHRRPIDQLLSIFFSRRRRYRCYEFSCQWEGNLKDPKAR